MFMINSSHIRCRIEPRDVPLEKAERRLHLTPIDFGASLLEPLARGFNCICEE
jgi:hypothetical protein